MKLDSHTRSDCKQLIRLALIEDLGSDRLDDFIDCTTQALIPPGVRAEAAFVSRRAGIVCGIDVAQAVLEYAQAPVELLDPVADGDRVAAGQTLGRLVGDADAILMLERTCLNFMGRLSGIATMTREFVDRVQGTGARILDTRKTTPGWRRLEKYAVASGGGTNHRMGLYDAILIKDNHLALRARLSGETPMSLHQAVELARSWVAEHQQQLPLGERTVVQVEVDRLDQFEQIITAEPDIILLDNMSNEIMARCVAIRNERAPKVLLEASGGITLERVRSVAETGVDRISVGALTHSAVNFDIGLDWRV